MITKLIIEFKFIWLSFVVLNITRLLICFLFINFTFGKPFIYDEIYFKIIKQY